MATKRKAVNIGTHSGTFHCDEALGCWMLKQTELFAGECGPSGVPGSSNGSGCRMLTRAVLPYLLLLLLLLVVVLQTATSCAAATLLCWTTATWSLMWAAHTSLSATDSTTTSAASARCLATATTQSCPVQVSGAVGSSWAAQSNTRGAAAACRGTGCCWRGSRHARLEVAAAAASLSLWQTARHSGVKEL
jgi:hypothetical protein